MSQARVTRASRKTGASGARKGADNATNDRGAQDTDTDRLAIETLQGVCRDAGAPAAARAQAARTLLELSGALRETRREETKKPSEMTGEEIDRELSIDPQTRDTNP